MKRKTLLIMITVFLIISFFVVLYYFRGVTIALLFSFLCAYLLYPPVDLFTEHSVPISISILVCYGISFCVVAFLISAVIPVMVLEFQGIIDSLPIYYDYILSLSKNYIAQNDFLMMIREFGFEEKIESLLNERTESLFEMTVGVISDIPQLILYILLVPVITYYFLRDKEKIVGNILLFFPPRFRVSVITVWNEVDKVIRGFIGGNLLVACIVGLMTGFGLFLFGVKYAALLGVFYGIMNIIPYFGPFIGSVPAVVFPALQGDVNIIWIILLLFTIQQVENYFISPRILGDHVGLHPVWVIVLVLAGGYCGGVLGMVVSIPLAAVLKVLITFVYKRFVAMPID